MQAAYDVCLRTGDGGRDATRLYDDPGALGRIYVGPYLKFEPALAAVAEDSAGVCGYVLGALDSRRFYQRYLEEWIPEIQRQFPAPPPPPASWTPTQRAYHDYHHPEVFCPEPYEDYPSHLHIDLVARVQGQGLGKRMIGWLLGELRARGSAGVHLGMHPDNARAEGFYKKLGFTDLARTGSGSDGTLYLGLKFR